MIQEELNNILELHKKWLNDEEDGVKANLIGANLIGADLSGADLIGANLRRADLSKANLSEADLSGADLIGANLRRADLSKANLSEADLRGANLIGANLSEADLSKANLIGANLIGADLIGANLSKANLSKANLREANLSEANLSGANLKNVYYNENTSFFVLQCPEKGAFIAYKKVRGTVIELEVPADAKRSSATTRKCRCSKAKVLGFYDLDKNELDINEVVNPNYVETIYRKGEMVYPDSWDEDRWNECSYGIHFFMTFDEAKNY